MGVQDELRWPRGAPDDERGHGQGGRWASALSAAMAPAGMLHGLMTHDQVASYLGRTDYEVFGQAGGANGSVEFRRYSDGTRLAHKSIMVFRDADRQHQAEVEASHVGHALGAPVPAVVFDPGSQGRGPAHAVRGPGLLMQYIDDGNWDDPGAANTAYGSVRGTPNAAMLGLFDLIIGNQDRNIANVLHPRGGLHGIDHGSSFMSTRYQGQPVQALSIMGAGGLAADIIGHEQVGEHGTAEWRAKPIQRYYSRAALKEARRRLQAAKPHVTAEHWDGMMRTLDYLENMTPETGGRELGQ